MDIMLVHNSRLMLGGKIGGVMDLQRLECLQLQLHRHGLSVNAFHLSILLLARRSTYLQDKSHDSRYTRDTLR